MTRDQLAHVLRAAQALTNETEFVLVGSQAALVGLEALPEVMAHSMELDIYPLRRPDLADLIEGAIGEGSTFHETYGFYAQGVGPETARLPAGWRQRSLRVSNALTGGAVGIAPDLHDICASKLAAFREKDLAYVAAALGARLIEGDMLRERLVEIPGLEPERAAQASAWIEGHDPKRGG